MHTVLSLENLKLFLMFLLTLYFFCFFVSRTHYDCLLFSYCLLCLSNFLSKEPFCVSNMVAKDGLVLVRLYLCQTVSAKDAEALIWPHRKDFWLFIISYWYLQWIWWDLGYVNPVNRIAAKMFGLLISSVITKESSPRW